MRILLVRNRYRSGAPSGENRVVDQEGESLEALGHEVVRFGRSSDEIAEWPVVKKASLPTRAIWSRETRYLRLSEHPPHIPLYILANTKARAGQYARHVVHICGLGYFLIVMAQLSWIMGTSVW